MLLAVACQDQTEPHAADVNALKEGDPAPEFTLSSPHEQVSLSEFRGKPVLLYFSMGPG